MILPTFFTIICESPSDARCDAPQLGYFVPEFDIPARDETIPDVIARIKEQLFPVAYVTKAGTDVTEVVALEWFRTLKRGGWVEGEPLPDFLIRHLPANVDIGYRPEDK